jgi:hypothetical protein
MRTTPHCVWSIALAVLSAACSNPTAPVVPPRPLPTVPPPPVVVAPSASIAGAWEGTATIESLAGTPPACTAPFWRTAVAQPLAAEIRASPSGSGLDMVLHQSASEACHLQVAASESRVGATPWPYDEFDCALVPSLCGLGCHFRLNSSTWNCGGTPPEVWILSVTLDGTIDAADRIQGSMEIDYVQRPGNTPSAIGWNDLTVFARFDLHR